MWCCSLKSTGVEPEFPVARISPLVRPAPLVAEPAPLVATAPLAAEPAPLAAAPVKVSEVELVENYVEEYPAQGEEVPVLNRDNAQEFENLGAAIAGLTIIGLLYLMMHETQDERPL
jgi:hypothetical protein